MLLLDTVRAGNTIYGARKDRIRVEPCARSRWSRPNQLTATTIHTRHSFPGYMTKRLRKDPLRLPVRLHIAEKGPFQRLPPALFLPFIQTFGKVVDTISDRGVVRDNDKDVLITVEFLEVTHGLRRQGYIVSEGHVVQRVRRFPAP